MTLKELLTVVNYDKVRYVYDVDDVHHYFGGRTECTIVNIDYCYGNEEESDEPSRLEKTEIINQYGDCKVSSLKFVDNCLCDIFIYGGKK